MKSGKIGGKRGDSRYMAKDEKHDEKEMKKQSKSMKTAGIASALKKAQKEEGYGKLVKVKPTRKV